MLTIENYFTRQELIDLKADPANKDMTDDELLKQTKPKTWYYIHDMLYYIVVTFTTVGYGDISPTSVPGRYAIIVFMIGFMGSF